ncbi:efflux RND transporter periplasmic adaptor subunit, partial [bacterium]|nr:efflux RND transporter periplasmic adaptor subunit [bacterium]
IAFNLMVIGSVSSIIFNGNPLTKLDSYYMLSDALEIPNLYERSRLQWYYLIEKYIYKVEQNYSPSRTKSEAFWLLLYGIASSFYRILISVGIALFVADQWLELGFVIIAISISMYIIKPSYGFFKYLFTDQKLERVRKRAMFTSFLFIALITFLIGFLPLSNNIYAPGIIHSNDYVHIFADTGGFLEKLYVSNGEKVTKGQVLLTLSNKELSFDLDTVKAQLEESYAQRKKVTKTQIADLKPLEERIEFLKSKLQLLLSKQEKLNIRAVASGIWYSSHLKQLRETWILSHRELGSIVPDGNFGFLAVITQGEAFDIFKTKEVVGNIKLRGLVEHTIEPESIQVLPYEKFVLPSAALGWYGGGEIAVGQKDGVTTLESFFEIRVTLNNSENENYFHQGRVGTLRIRLEDQTIFESFYKFLKQLLQKRYSI